jgi:hypothetical protein
MSKINHFIIFSLESYKSATGIAGKQALKDFEDYDVFSYLTNGFEVLHTQSREYIVADIIEYMANRKRK